MPDLGPVVKAEEVADEIRMFGGSAISVAGDILDVTHLETLVKRAAEFGGGKIHIIVNNAGYTWDAVIHKVCRKENDSSRIANYFLAEYQANCQTPGCEDDG